jgi:multidrug efflux pump subunit AcrB
LSSQGRGYIDMTLKKGVNMDLIRFEIASHIRRLYPDFPQGVSYPTITVNRAAGRTNPLLNYTLVAPEPSHLISEYVEKYMLPALSQIQGLDNVLWYGTNPLEFQVVYDPRKLELWGLSMRDMENALGQYFGEHFAGMGYVPETVMGQGGRMAVTLTASRHPDLLWDRIPIGRAGNRVLYLTDVADVSLQERPPQTFYRINGQNTLLLSVFAARGENQIRLSDKIRREMDGLQQQMPPGWQAVLTYDDTSFIRRDLRRVSYRMLFSFSVLMVFVLLVSRSYRYLLMIFVTVIANLAVAIGWYYFLDIEIHLYSLAGITVSFGIIIDNSIVMIEHLRTHGNRRVFLAILAATLTTMGSLSVIFMLGAQQQAQLHDFAAVVLVNLMLSLVIAWFFIPAVFSSIRMQPTRLVVFSAAGRRRVRWGLRYQRVILFLRRYRWLVFTVLILGFGLPVHLLPTKVEGEGVAAGLYNKTIGGRFYQQRMKRTAEKALGGTFRLFSRFVYEGSFFTDPERTTLFVRGRMPDGSTVHQLNEAIAQMDAFLAGFPQIEQFQTRVLAHNNGFITILFHPEHDRGSFPHYLQNLIIQKAISIGGADWQVSGVGQGFSNALRSGGGGASIALEGYNYEHLYRYTELLAEMASRHPRVVNLQIHGTEAWRSPNRMEFFMAFDARQLSLRRLDPGTMYRGLDEKLAQQHLPAVMVNQKPVNVRLLPSSHLNYSVWDMENLPLHIGGKVGKTSGLMQLEKRAMGNDIYKTNQQYRLLLYFDFHGPYLLQERVVNQLAEEINDILPLGYHAEVPRWGWQQDKSRQYLLIFLVIIIIYFICSILLESLQQPLAIIGLIPVSFAGLFLTFYVFSLNFDQGGWAAFILLSGLSVNAGLYILNDFNNFRKSGPGRSLAAIYLKAFQYKITPVILTIASTIIGLIPFVIGQREAFWFAFAAGTIGGLVFSLLGILVFFPVFLRLGRR